MRICTIVLIPQPYHSFGGIINLQFKLDQAILEDEKEFNRFIMNSPLIHKPETIHIKLNDLTYSAYMNIIAKSWANEINPRNEKLPFDYETYALVMLMFSLCTNNFTEHFHE